MTIFEFTDLSEYLRSWMKEAKERNPKTTYASMAEQIQMQKSTFSKVLAGKYPLTSDQVFLLSRYLGLNEDETDFFYLLVEYQQSNLAVRREALLRKIIKIQKNKVKSASRLGAQNIMINDRSSQIDYFMSPFAAIVHVYLSVPKYQSQPEMIARELNITLQELNQTLVILEKLGLVERTHKNLWVSKQARVHIEDQAEPTRNQQLLLRAIALQRIAAIPLAERFGLSVTFSSEPKAIEESRQVLVRATQEIYEITKNTKSQSVYQINIDLFPWGNN